MLKLTTSRKTTNVYICDEEDFVSHYDGRYNYDLYKNYVAVPENIVLTLTLDGTELVRATVKTDLSMSSEVPNLSKDKYNVKVDVKVNNYDFIVSQFSYTGQSNASISYSMKKDGKTLLTLSASGSTKIENEGYDDIEIIEGKLTDLKVDVLGELQVKGSCSDVTKLIDNIQDANNNSRNESLFKSYITHANSLLNLKVYYDGGSKQRATVKLESFVDRNYYGDEWYSEPVFFFDDATSYSSFEAFFNEKDFKKVIDDYNYLVKQFKNLIN